MPTPDVDVSAILSALEHHKVKYVVIGGFAAELHDVAIAPHPRHRHHTIRRGRKSKPTRRRAEGSRRSTSRDRCP